MRPRMLPSNGTASVEVEEGGDRLCYPHLAADDDGASSDFNTRAVYADERSHVWGSSPRYPTNGLPMSTWQQKPPGSPELPNASEEMHSGSCHGSVAHQPDAVFQLPSIDVKEALEILECPICLDALLPPIYQCREGHPLCNECLMKLKVCPTCRTGPVDVRCRGLDRLAESIGDVACRYAALGCQERIRFRTKREHEIRCCFKSFQCLHSDMGCNFEGSCDDLVRHLIAAHSYEELKTTKIQFICNRRTLRSGSPDGTYIWQQQVYNCFGKYFVLRVHRRIDGDAAVYVSLVVLHSKHHSNRYIVSTHGNHRRYTFEGQRNRGEAAASYYKAGLLPKPVFLVVSQAPFGPCGRASTKWKECGIV